MLMRTRLISRVMTAIYDAELRSFGIGSSQFALLASSVAWSPSPAPKLAATSVRIDPP
jgi:hypothetical protein